MNRIGVTLIEMVVVIVIMSIVIALTLPMIKPAEKAKIDKARNNLELIRIAQKRHFLTNNTFSSDIDSLDIENPNDSAFRYFDYTIESADAADFTARAQRRSNAPSPYDTYYYEISKEGTISSFPPGNPF